MNEAQEIINNVEPWWHEIAISIILLFVRHFEKRRLKRKINTLNDELNGKASPTGTSERE